MSALVSQRRQGSGAKTRRQGGSMTVAGAMSGRLPLVLRCICHGQATKRGSRLYFDQVKPISFASSPS